MSVGTGDWGLVMQRLSMVRGDVSMIDKHSSLATSIGPSDVLGSYPCISRRITPRRHGTVKEDFPACLPWHLLLALEVRRCNQNLS